MYPSDIATSTFTGFFQTIFSQGLQFAIYIVQYTWPYLLGLGAFFFLWRIAKRWLRF